MKRVILLLSGLILSALVSGVASAESVRVRLTGRVTEVSDINNVLGGKVVLGSRVNGLYVYNTNTPNEWPPGGTSAQYRPYANEARLRFAIGGLVFESKQPTTGITITIYADPWNGNRFEMQSLDNKPLANGSPVDFMSLVLAGNGNGNQSVALPAVAPILQNYFSREVNIFGGNVAPQSFFNIRLMLESAELIETAAIEVTPASSTFAANQHFDAAVILPRNSNVQSAQVTGQNGVPMFSYPGACHFQPQVEPVGKPSLLCPGVDWVLQFQQSVPLTWTVTMTDGTVYTETVTWDRAP